LDDSWQDGKEAVDVGGGGSGADRQSQAGAGLFAGEANG
jgi:hypothetical protein